MTAVIETGISTARRIAAGETLRVASRMSLRASTMYLGILLMISQGRPAGVVCVLHSPVKAGHARAGDSRLDRTDEREQGLEERLVHDRVQRLSPEMGQRVFAFGKSVDVGTKL